MMRRYLREISVAVAFALWMAVLAVVAPGFFKPQQLWAMLVENSSVLVAAMGMSLIIIARHIDISIGSQFSVCGIVAALLAQNGWPMLAVVFATMLVGVSLGAINGWLVAERKLPSIVVTLATMVILRETLRWVREGEFVRNLPSGFQWFGASQSVGQWLVVSIALAVFGVMAWSMRNLAIGRAVYAVGSDQEAARLAGIRPPRVVLGVFVLMGLLTGLAALLNAVRFSDIAPNLGDGRELQVIASVVVGGVAIAGGRGTLVGTLIGVALLGSINPALTFLHVQPQWEKAIQGLIILAAVASDALRSAHSARAVSAQPVADSSSIGRRP